MIRLIAIFILLLPGLSAQELEVSADKFVAKDAQKTVVFQGNAQVKKGTTVINAGKITVHFDENNNTKMYKAQQNVRFEIISKESRYKGRCNQLIYYPNKSTYHLRGATKVTDVLKKRTIYGETIDINEKTGSYIIQGSRHKPAKLIFTIKKKR